MKNHSEFSKLQTPVQEPTKLNFVRRQWAGLETYQKDDVINYGFTIVAALAGIGLAAGIYSSQSEQSYTPDISDVTIPHCVIGLAMQVPNVGPAQTQGNIGPEAPGIGNSDNDSAHTVTPYGPTIGYAAPAPEPAPFIGPIAPRAVGAPAPEGPSQMPTNGNSGPTFTLPQCN